MVLNRVRPQLISHGKSGNIDDAMDEAGLPLLGLVPEDVDLISCSNSGRSIHVPSSAPRARLAPLSISPGGSTASVFHLNCKKSRNKYTRKGVIPDEHCTDRT